MPLQVLRAGAHGPGHCKGSAAHPARAQLGQGCGCAGTCPPGWGPELMPCRSTGVPVVLLTLPMVSTGGVLPVPHVPGGGSGTSAQWDLQEPGALRVPLLLWMLSWDRGGSFSSGHRAGHCGRPWLEGGSCHRQAQAGLSLVTNSTSRG